MKKVLLSSLAALIFALVSLNTFAQNADASTLRKQIASTKSDSLRLGLKIELAKTILDSKPDSALVVASQAYNESKKGGYHRFQMTAANILGNYYQRINDFTKAEAFYHESGVIAKRSNDLQGLAGYHNNIGIILVNKGDFNKAIAEFLEAFKYEEKRGNKQGMAECFNNIAVVNYYMKDFDKCAESLSKAAEISESMGDKALMSKVYNNNGAIMEMAKKYDKALKFFQKSLDNSVNDKEISIAVQNMANIYVRQKKFDKADQLYKRATALKQKLGDFQGLATLYTSIGAYYEEVQDFAKAQEYYYQSVSISKDKGLKNQEFEAYKALSNLSKLRKDYQLAMEYQHKADTLKDSIFSIEKAKSYNELQTRYETAQKETELAKERANVATSKLTIKQRNNTIILVCSGFVIFLIIAFGWYNRNQYKQRQYRKTVELKQKLDEAEMKNKIQGERERISRDLHDHIGSQLTLIISGLDNMSFQEQKKNHEDASGKLNDLSDQARQTMDQLRETIWAMNKEAVSVEVLVSKIREFTNKANRDIKTMVSGNADVIISPAKSLAMFRVCQEAINNAIKHAEFNTLDIHVNSAPDSINVLIKDDGKGFDVSEATSRGYGLENMAFRVQECGGHYKLFSAPGSGTRIEMEFAIPDFSSNQN